MSSSKHVVFADLYKKTKIPRLYLKITKKKKTKKFFNSEMVD
jgi:hypothetical protein